VFTEIFHLRRGSCCGAGCRHCPFGHQAVPAPCQSPRSWAPTWVAGKAPIPAGEAVDVVFWSGGKDSWLAWQAARGTGRGSVWLTTYDPARNEVPIQGIGIGTIRHQAARAGQTLALVPVGADRDYGEALRDGLETIRRHHPIERLVFGDLWLEDVRQARERTLGEWALRHGAALWLPLWGVPAEALLDRLFASDGPGVRISASEIAGVAVGDRYDRELVGRLPPGVDPMGEGGELHTVVDL
jgi:diphthamide synthase (EF-2-diphthine--ammonia ligase)